MTDSEIEIRKIEEVLKKLHPILHEKRMIYLDLMTHYINVYSDPFYALLSIGTKKREIQKIEKEINDLEKTLKKLKNPKNSKK